MEYDAFISYSHAADGQLARELQSGLQRLAKPWFRRPIIKIFRDETSLSATPGLWSEIERNLARSKHFVLLASAASARSPWVEREVSWWIAHRPRETLFIAVTDGTLAWKAEAADFDWSSTTCLPATLKGWFTEEPLYVDLTWSKGRNDLSLRHSQFRAAVLDLAAPLHGRAKDELDSEDIRQNRRLRAAAWSGVSLIVVLAIGALIAAWVAIQNANEAVRQSITATSRQLAVEAQLDVRDGRLADAVTAALKATRTEDTAESRAALVQALEAAWDIHAVLRLHQSPVLAMAFRNGSRELLTWSADSLLVHWDVSRRRPLRPPIHGEHLDVRSAVFSPDTHLLAAGLAAGEIVIWDTESMQVRATLKEPGLPGVTALAFDPSGTLLAAGYGTDGAIILWDVERSVRMPTRFEQPERLAHDFATSGLSFSEDGRYLAAANENPSASVGVWTLPSGKLVASLNPSTSFWVNERVGFFASGGGTALAVGCSDGSLQIFRESTGGAFRFQHVTSLSPHEGDVSAVATSAGRLATAGGEGLVSMWEDIGGRPIVPAGWTRARVSSLAFSSGAELLAAGSSDGSVTIYYAAFGRLASPRMVDDVARNASAVRRSPDRKWIVSSTAPAGGVDKTVSLVYAPTRRTVIQAVTGDVTFSPDSRWMVVSSDGNMGVWNLSDEQSARQPVLTRRADRVSVSPSGTLIAIETLTQQGEIRLVDLAGGSIVEHVLQHGVFGQFRGFSADGRFVLTTAERALRLWDAARGTTIGSPIPLEPLSDDDDDDDRDVTIFSQDSRWFMAGRALGTKSLHRTDGGQGDKPFPVPQFAEGRFSADGKWIMLQTTGHAEGLWNLATLTPLFQSETGRPADWTFTSDSRWFIRTVATVGRGLSAPPHRSVQIWDLRRASSEARVLPETTVDRVEVSPDGRWLLAPDGNERTRVWELATLQAHALPVSLNHPHAFSPDGRRLAADEVGPIALVEIASGTRVIRLEGHTKRLHDITFSPDGRVLASIDANGALIEWDVESGRRLSQTLAGPGEDEDTINKVRFDADGKTLSVGIPAHPLTWIEDICHRIDPGLSREEWTQAVTAIPYPWTCDEVAGLTPGNLAQTMKNAFQK